MSPMFLEEICPGTALLPVNLDKEINWNESRLGVASWELFFSIIFPYIFHTFLLTAGIPHLFANSICQKKTKQTQNQIDKEIKEASKQASKQGSQVNKQTNHDQQTHAYWRIRKCRIEPNGGARVKHCKQHTCIKKPPKYCMHHASTSPCECYQNMKLPSAQASSVVLHNKSITAAFFASIPSSTHNKSIGAWISWKRNIKVVAIDEFEDVYLFIRLWTFGNQHVQIDRFHKDRDLSIHFIN